MTQRFGVISKNVVLVDEVEPVFALIIIDNELITEIIKVPQDDPEYETLKAQYSDLEIVDYQDLVISPGIIDLNCKFNGDWEGASIGTKAALSGGTTFVLEQPSIFNQERDDEDYFCDIGKVEIIDQNSIDQIAMYAKTGIMGFKAYLQSPSMYVGDVHNLKVTLQKVADTGLPLFLDVNYADEKMLFLESPNRFRDFEKRRETQDVYNSHFLGAITEDPTGPMGSSEESEDEDEVQTLDKKEKNPGLKSIQSDMPMLNPIQNMFPCEDEDEEEETKNEELDNDPVDLEAMRATTMKMGVADLRRVNMPTIYETLDVEITKAESSGQDSIRAEFGSYQSAGRTVHRNATELPKPPTLTRGHTESHVLDLKKQEAEKKQKEEAAKKAAADSNAPPVQGAQRLARIRPSGLNLKAPAPTGPKPVNRDSIYINHLANVPEQWEISGVNVLGQALTEDINVKIHVQNICSARSANKLRKIKTAVESLTMDTAPHYLFFTDRDVEDGNTRLKCYPPIRNSCNCNLMWDCLKMNIIDCIASQHEPICKSMKFLEELSFKKALSGITNAGFSLQAIWSRLKQPLAVRSRNYNHYIVRLAKWMSVTPSKILGIDNQRGSIAVGKLADFVIWDPEKWVTGRKSWSLQAELNPYVNHALCGEIRVVFLRGKLVYSEGEFSEPSGKFVWRSSTS